MPSTARWFKADLLTYPEYVTAVRGPHNSETGVALSLITNNDEDHNGDGGAMFALDAA